jgi:hypothetical protein
LFDPFDSAFFLLHYRKKNILKVLEQRNNGLRDLLGWRLGSAAVGSAANAFWIALPREIAAHNFCISGSRNICSAFSVKAAE